jgi:8-oxo-dGTP pyrophosphatase MutT (NUDIX family)
VGYGPRVAATVDGAGAHGVGADFTATLPVKRMAAGVLLFDDAGRVLLVEPTYKEHWEIPGGTVEADESPYAAACRELTEELGLSRTPGRLLVLDWVPPRPPRTEGVMLLFDGGRLTEREIGGLTVPAEELRGFAFCAAQEASARLPAPLTRRVAAAVRALETGAVAYLEDGLAVV